MKTLDFFLIDWYNHFRASGCGEVWYRAWFGTKRPWVQIPPLRPNIRFSLLREPDISFVRDLNHKIRLAGGKPGSQFKNWLILCFHRRGKCRQVPPLRPRRRGLHIVRDDIFLFKANAISHSFRHSSLPNRTRSAGLRFGFDTVPEIPASISFCDVTDIRFPLLREPDISFVRDLNHEIRLVMRLSF